MLLHSAWWWPGRLGGRTQVLWLTRTPTPACAAAPSTRAVTPPTVVCRWLMAVSMLGCWPHPSLMQPALMQPALGGCFGLNGPCAGQQGFVVNTCIKSRPVVHTTRETVSKTCTACPPLKTAGAVRWPAAASCCCDTPGSPAPILNRRLWSWQLNISDEEIVRPLLSRLAAIITAQLAAERVPCRAPKRRRHERG